MSSTSPYVVEADLTSFPQVAIESSRERPVVVDFWATWCQPCRILGPVLEKLADEYGGRFLLVKAETERLPDVAARFGVRSIPAVFGLRDGKVVDSFVGALPEKAIRAWVERLFPTPAETLTAEAHRLETTDPDAAEAKYREAMALDERSIPAKIGLARLLLTHQRLDEARPLIESLGSPPLLGPEAERGATELAIRLRAQEAGSVEANRAVLAATPNDRSASLRLAVALAAEGAYPEALDLCLDLVERERGDLRESARKTMVDIFRLLGDAEIVGDYQRKLSAALY